MVSRIQIINEPSAAKAMTPDQQREAFESAWRLDIPNFRRRLVAMLERKGILVAHRGDDGVVGLEFIKPDHPAAVAVLKLIAEEIGPPVRDENGELPLVVVKGV